MIQPFYPAYLVAVEIDTLQFHAVREPVDRVRHAIPVHREHFPKRGGGHGGSSAAMLLAGSTARGRALLFGRGVVTGRDAARPPMRPRAPLSPHEASFAPSERQ